VIVHLGQHQRRQLAFRKALIFVERLAVYLVSDEALLDGRATTGAHIHLTQSFGDLGPYCVDIVIQRLERVDLEVGLWIGKERKHADG
jgi:hypothetical protein